MADDAIRYNGCHGNSGLYDSLCCYSIAIATKENLATQKGVFVSATSTMSGVASELLMLHELYGFSDAVLHPEVPSGSRGPG